MLDAFKKYLEMTCVFPLDAQISEYQENGPLNEGDKISVKGISGVDDLFGLIVEIRHGCKKYHFPLLDIEVIDKGSVNYQPVENYKVWFANNYL
ncbi:Calcium binding protein [Pelotomaculum sp. FP]|uniref:calcium-binding protein n=1 Tax=Pelotomaculum sp. FP TaxID=261474 RepID=UPI001066EF9C|nr:calcium-binding protein [Pelotomaculum sp. FP]TEB15227.1 Calcium binding protein [Pelotomaculum sp. FP]